MHNMLIDNLLKQHHLSMPIADIVTLSIKPNAYIFLKDQQSRYHYANTTFVELMGLETLQQLQQSTDLELSHSRQEAKKYHDLDCQVIEEAKSLHVSEMVAPKYNQPICHTMEGTMYPIFSDRGKAEYVMGIVTPKKRLMHLDWDTVFKLELKVLDGILTRRSYPIVIDGFKTTLSKMEIKTLVQLLKGYRADETAELLQIKQTTVESYLKNIRNKLAVSTKSELINTLIRESILEQILL